MKRLLIVLIAITITGLAQQADSEKGTFFDTVKFIQYLDENTALEQVRNGNLDMYYYRISSDRLETQQSREGLQVHDSAGGSYSILVNPAESKEFNPFSIQEVRFALNYLIDRKLIVNELMGGFGSPTSSYYGLANPEFLTVIESLEKFNFRYNPVLAQDMITGALIQQGAIKNMGQWEIDSEPIKITIFIRSDDPIRKSIGELLSAELENIGFQVKKEFGDLNKAFVIVYGSDPAELKWNLYTEAWSSSAFVKYDSVGISQMYAPWFSNMPGFNNPAYWNYENKEIDDITQKIYTGDFDSQEKRAKLIQDAIVRGVNQSVRVFLASTTDQYVANEKISGIVNDFGAGVPSRFTPINARADKEQLVIGVKQIYQGAWNPVMGLTDTYSRHIWGIVSDPGTFKHPFTGKTIPIRADWKVETAGPDGKLSIPADAKMWNPNTQIWDNVGDNIMATSIVTFDYKFADWHHGEPMDINDVLYSLYFTVEWGTQLDENDKTYDPEFTPRAAQSIDTIKGIKQIDDNTIQVFVDYWHFDKGEIAQWAELQNVMPWEIISAMEQTVLEGKASFSRSGATGKNTRWLSLVIPNDASEIKDALYRFSQTSYIPDALKQQDVNSEYLQDRYTASIMWINDNNHAVISNGPYYLKSYSPESRTILVESFSNESYPFDAGRWSEFEDPKFPTIKEIKINDIIKQGDESVILLDTENADHIMYFLTDGHGQIITSKTINNTSEITITPKETNQLSIGANSVKIFLISDDILKPDFYETNFIITETETALPTNDILVDKSIKEEPQYQYLIILAIIIPLVIYFKKRSR